MSNADTATWESPGTGYSVEYQLPVFREIEFLVNDGFRRIPHGGIETGGLLFGSVHDGVVRIESFQPIECEHAYGPSFQLSDRDIEQLRQQVATAAQDPALEGLAAIGWFIAHTRSELVLNDRESTLFNQLFPEPGRVTVLVKPERFKATRFAFLVRDRNGTVEPDGGPIAFMLPQGERTATARRERTVEPGPEPKAIIPEPPPEPGPLPAPPPPARTAPVEVRAEPLPVPQDADATAREVVPEPARLEPQAREETSREETAREETAREETAREETAREDRPVLPPPQRRGIGRERPVTPGISDDDTAPGIISRAPFARSEPVTRSEPAMFSAGSGAGGGLLAGSLLTWSLFGASLVFAVLAIYGLYLRFAPGVVPVTVTPSGDSFLVSWPAAETRDADAAEVRVNNGPARPLSNEERASGTFSMRAGGGDLMVDLVVHHRFRTARGITRYLVMPGASGQ